MTFIMDIIKGIFIGIANVIPGVSGGTMAVSLGIYDKLISSVSGLLKHWKKSLIILLPIVLGCGIGIIGFTYTIEFLLSSYTFVTCMTFVGLILGGIPILVRALRKNLHQSGSSIGISGMLAFILLFSIAVFLPMLNPDTQMLKTFTPNLITVASLFLVGIIASATMVVPGVSGSLVMMVLGYYYGILELIKSFFEALNALDLAGILNSLKLLVPFGIGVLLGIFLIAKLITFLFQRYGIQTYCAILGLIAASPFAIFYNTGLISKLHYLKAGSVIAGIVLAVIGAVVTCFLGEKSE